MTNNKLIDVRLSWEIFGIASNIDRVGALVDTDPVHSHLSGEGEMLKVDDPKILRYSQVHDQVLQHMSDPEIRDCVSRKLTIGSWGTGRAEI